MKSEGTRPVGNSCQNQSSEEQFLFLQEVELQIGIHKATGTGRDSSYPTGRIDSD